MWFLSSVIIKSTKWKTYTIFFESIGVYNSALQKLLDGLIDTSVHCMTLQRCKTTGQNTIKKFDAKEKDAKQQSK